MLSSPEHYASNVQKNPEYYKPPDMKGKSSGILIAIVPATEGAIPLKRVIFPFWYRAS